MKKGFAILLSAVLIFSLSACGSTAEKSISKYESGTTVLTLALREGTYADVIEDCVKQFEEENDVKCEILKLSEDDLHSTIAGSAKDDNAIDLCMVDGSWLAEFASGGLLADLSELGYSLDDDIIDATKDIAYYDGKFYLTPYYGNVTVLLYNKALVEEAGGSEIESPTLEQLLDISKTVSDSGKIGFIYRGDTENNIVVDFLPILLSYGGWVIDGDENPTVDSEQFKAAVSYYKELAATGTHTVKDDLIVAIDGGNAAMAIGWPGWYTPTDDSSADYIAMSGKESTTSPAYNANVYGVWALGISSNSHNKEISAKLLEYLMDPDVQKSTVANGGVPCRYSSLQDPDILESHPQFGAVCEALESGVYRPFIKEWNEFVTILGSHMMQIMNDEESIDEGLSAAQSELEDLMQK